MLSQLFSDAICLHQMLSSQVQQHLEGPIGMALYEWQDGKIGMACVHGGQPVIAFAHDP